MKQLIFTACLFLGVGALGARAQQKEFKETIRKEIPLANSVESTLVVRNVFGSVEVEGYQGNQVIVEVERTIMAKSTEDLELGKGELQLEIVQEPKRIIFHPDAPYINFDKDRLSYNWCNNNDIPYEHRLNFKLKVPSSVTINVSTINDGEIVVKNTKGDHVVAANINGGITLTNIMGKTYADCINGPVTISYAENPKDASRYHALNGDINISYQKSLSANISFKSMNGDLYTDFDISKQFVKTDKDKGNRDKPKYKFEATPVVQIGSGQVDFDFETMNGNVFIKKI